MMVWQAGVLAHGMYFQVAMSVRDAVHVHGPIAALSGDIFVERIPRDTLYEMIVFGHLVDTFTCMKVSIWHGVMIFDAYHPQQ